MSDMQMKRILLGGLLVVTGLISASTGVRAQFISVNDTVPSTLTYTQNFNSLSSVDGATPAWSNGNTINGFYTRREAGAQFSTYRADGGSDTTPGIYSYGAPGGADRAFGSIAAVATNSIYYGFNFRNVGPTPLTSITVTFDFEFWHRADSVTGNQRIDFSFSTDAISLTGTGEYTNVAALSYEDGDFGAASGDSLVPIKPVQTKTANITFATPVLTNENIWIRWQDVNDAGTNANHGFAIDNVDVTFQPVPAPPAAVSLGIGGLVGLVGTGANRLRRRRRVASKTK